ncbi:hypothetical protein ACIGEP_16405 [Microbacterium sp. NPDC077663]|uniref:hypothetical protein n=1 Tax=Microbacterium sp. NPDC077663 TaxID=3364189 RepID=UPI0037C79B11
MRGIRSAATALRALATLVLVGGTVGVPAAAFATAPDDIVVVVPERDDQSNPPEGGLVLDDAQLRWGLNAESGSGAFAGGCNFLSAGQAGDTGGARVWTEADGFYRAESGSVRIEKPTGDGAWEAASWATKCLDPSGAPVTASSTSSATGNQVVMDAGVGTRSDSGLEIRWSGSFSVVFYGGMTYWSVSDPVLTLDEKGSGRLTATASGFATSMEDLTNWQPIAARQIVLADIHGADSQEGEGFTVTPEYLGVTSRGSGQIDRGSSDASIWGSFPQSFVDFHRLTGQQGYWVTTGGIRDAAKPASPLTVSFDAAAPIDVPPPTTGTASAGSPAKTQRPALPLPAPIAAPLAEVVAANAPLVTQLLPPGLIPQAAAGLPALVLPLLGTGAAFGLGIVAVLSLLRLLPWQTTSRVGIVPGQDGTPVDSA